MLVVGAIGGIFLGIICIVVSIVRAYREKDTHEPVHYYGVGLGFFVCLTFVSALLDKYTLAAIFMVPLLIVGFASLPSIHKYNKRKNKEALASVNLSAPPGLRELFTTSTGWLRYGYSYGAGKTIFIMWLILTPICIGLLLIAGLSFGIGFIESSITSYITSSTGCLILSYYVLKSVLKKHLEMGKPLEAELARSPEELYEEILRVYTEFYGGGQTINRQVLENEIKSFTKQGLSREEAITKIAEKEKI